MLSSTGTSTGPIRRRRGQLSCTSCKKKKLACDRKTPCDRCKRRSEPCVYEDISERHAPSPRTDTSNVVPMMRSDKIQVITTTTRRPIAYFTLHSLVKFFAEIPQLSPFFAETVQEWLLPSGINMKKPKLNVPIELPLETLLPPSADTDHLVNFYLDHFERLHRVVHIPTFRRQYGYAKTTHTRKKDTAFNALILAMLSIAVSADPSSIALGYRSMTGRWIWSCERWLNTQSSKHRDLVHYQVWCLVYMAKRVNGIHKKHYWTDTGSLIQNAIFDGITQHPPGETVYSAELRKRLWLTIRELDLLNSFEYGLPTLLYNVRVGIDLPSNIDDEDFDESTEEAVIGRSGDTRMTFQLTSAMSFELRLETSQHIFGGRGSTNGIGIEDYDDVLRQTHKLTQAIPNTTIMHPFIRSQLQICILAMHRPSLDIEHKLSLDICYHISRDILLRFSNHEFVPYIRDDINTAFLTVVRISLLEDKADDPVKLLEENLSWIDQRYLRSYDGEPKVLLTLHAGVMLLKLHLGMINRSDAKYKCAQTFLHLHEKKMSDRHTGQSQNQSQGGSMDDASQLFDYDLFDFENWFTEETERNVQ